MAEEKKKKVGLKTAIKQVINEHTKFTAVKVWNLDVQEFYDGSIVLTIEISAKKKNTK